MSFEKIIGYENVKEGPVLRQNKRATKHWFYRPMASTSSLFPANWFLFCKKAQTSPSIEPLLFLKVGFYTTGPLSRSLFCPLSPYCHITICLIAFFNRRITSSICSELCFRYRIHPTSPTFIVSSQTYRDRIP